MVYCGLTGKTDLNPYALAKKAEEQGYYVEGVGTAWELMTNFAEGIGLKSEEDMYSAEGLLEELKAGHPSICAVGEGDFTITGHFIVLYGVNSDGTVKVYDPNSCKLSEKSWDIYEILDQSRDLWTFSYDPNAKKASSDSKNSDSESGTESGSGSDADVESEVNSETEPDGWTEQNETTETEDAYPSESSYEEDTADTTGESAQIG